MRKNVCYLINKALKFGCKSFYDYKESNVIILTVILIVDMRIIIVDMRIIKL